MYPQDCGLLKLSSLFHKPLADLIRYNHGTQLSLNRIMKEDSKAGLTLAGRSRPSPGELCDVLNKTDFDQADCRRFHIDILNALKPIGGHL